MSSGHERRNSNWQAARGRWNVAHGLKKREQVAALIAFFRARRGRAYGFHFKNWTDYQGFAQDLIGLTEFADLALAAALSWPGCRCLLP